MAVSEHASGTFVPSSVGAGAEQVVALTDQGVYVVLFRAAGFGTDEWDVRCWVTSGDDIDEEMVTTPESLHKVFEVGAESLVAYGPLVVAAGQTWAVMAEQTTGASPGSMVWVANRIH